MEFRAEEASPQLVNKKFLVYIFVSDTKLFRIVCSLSHLGIS